MTPSIGRIVHYQRRNLAFTEGVEGSIVPEAALIVQVHNESLVNLQIFSGNGSTEFKTSVRLGDEGEANTWIWPPRV